jgi:hypothetical protein
MNDFNDFDFPLVIDKDLNIKSIDLYDIYVKSYLIYFKRPGYFIYSLIITLMYIYPDLYIIGGCVRDLFLANKIPHDIDVYCNEITYNNLIKTIEQILKKLYYKIFNKNNITIKYQKYNVYTAIHKKQSTKIEISTDFGKLLIDVNIKTKYKLCSCTTKEYDNNFDYIQNSLSLSMIKKENKYKIILKTNMKINQFTYPIQKYLNRISPLTIINKFISNKNLSNIILVKDRIYSFLGYKHIILLQIIYTITQYEMYAAHILCDNLNYKYHKYNNGEKCIECVDVFNNMYYRNNKYKNYGFNTYIEKCNKQLCVCSGIYNNTLLQTDSDKILKEYTMDKTKLSFSEYINKKCAIGSYHKDLPFNIKLESIICGLLSPYDVINVQKSYLYINSNEYRKKQKKINKLRYTLSLQYELSLQYMSLDDPCDECDQSDEHN